MTGDWVSVALHVYARIRSEGWQIGNVNIGNVESKIPEIAGVFYLDFLKIIFKIIIRNVFRSKYAIIKLDPLGFRLRYVFQSKDVLDDTSFFKKL